MFKVKFHCLTTGISVALILILSGCGGGGGSVDVAAANAGGSDVGGPDTTAPADSLAINGAPATSITAGLTYTFVPTSSGGSGGTLTYSITNNPSWASFDPGTGAMTGTPGMGDIGITAGIVISVSNGKENAALNPFDLAVIAAGNGAATLSWTAPTENTDGSPLMTGDLPSDLAGYKVYYGPSANSLLNVETINNSTISTYLVENLSSGTWFFVVTAFNQVGIESDFSNIASKTIPTT